MAAINPRRMMTHSRSRTTSHEPAAGFTLTEIMVAVAIVGILLAIAVWQYQSHSVHARIAGALEFASESRTRVALELAHNRNVKTDLLNNDGNPVNDITGLVWYPAKSGESVTGHILVTMKLPGHGIRNVFALELKQGANWQCVNAARYADPATTLDNEYLPMACREGAAPLSTQAGRPEEPSLQVKSACPDSNPGARKSKSETPAQTKSCTPEELAAAGMAATGGAATTGSSSTGSSSNSGSTGSSGSSGSSDSTGSGDPSGQNRGTDGSSDSKAASAAAALATGNVTAGAAANAAAPGGSAATAATAAGDGARIPGTDKGFSTKGGSTTVCAQPFEAFQNACTLAGSPAPRLCRSEKENCETVHVTGSHCPAAQPFAANVVENLSDGSRYVTRRCVSLGEAFQGIKKNRETQACANYDADKATYARFTCMFPCYGNDCNRSIVPGDSATRLTWDNDIVEAGSGRKRGKTSADLPDIFDTWVCPRGTRPDLKTAGQCLRDTPVAATANGKGFEGTKK